MSAPFVLAVALAAVVAREPSPSAKGKTTKIAQEADGTWPDGSLKGTFTCAESGLP